MNKKEMMFNEVNISYFVKGDPNKETFVFLHPAFGDSTIFVDQLDHFGKTNFCIAIDMIGHGESQQGFTPKASMGDMPEIISQILDQEGVEKANVVGVSLGSLIAQGFAFRFPIKVKSVTIVGGYSIHRGYKEIQKVQNDEIKKWIFKLIFSIKKFREYIINSTIFTTERGREIFAKGVQAIKRSSFLSMNGMNLLFVESDENITYPLFIVVGDHDLELAKDAGKMIVEVEPKAKYVEIRDAGHCANVDRPEEFNELLASFVDFLK